MYSYTLRLAAASSSSIAGLGRVGGRTRAGSVVPACGRSVSSTPAGNAPVPGVQGVGMEQPQQQQPQVPPQDAAGDKNKRDDMHKTIRWDVMTHSFGEAYATRCDEEGFGGVYGQNDPVENPGTEIHPSHPRDDMHKTIRWDVMTHSFGEGYATRCDDEGFGGVYGQNDPVENPGTEIHPSHPEYDTSQGSEVKEKEKARHLKDDKHATA